MITAPIANEFNQHVTLEMYSSQLYLSMAAWCESQGLKGFSHWMRLQAEEERSHVMRFFDFILDRGGKVELGAIDAPPTTWGSPLEVFEAAHAHELEVSERIHALVDSVLDARDHPANAFLQWFVNEQVEEEATVSDVVSRLQRVGDDGRGVLLIDQELTARTEEANEAKA